MKIKKVIAVAAGIALPLGAVMGGIYGYKSYQDKNLVAEVQPVSNINMGYWGDSQTSYGMVTNDSSQEIYLASAKTVKKVYVEEGDDVKIGDPLLAYDTAEINIEIEGKKLQIQTIENDLARASNKLNSLKQAKPVDKTPPKIDTKKLEEYEAEDAKNNALPDTDVLDNRIYNYLTESSIPYNVKLDATTGELVYPAGTVDDPYIYYCNPKAYAYGSFFNAIRPSGDGTPGKYVKFFVCKKDASGKMVMTGESIDASGNVIAPKPVVDTEVTPNTAELNGNSIPADYDTGRMWYLFTGEEYIPTSLADAYMEKFMENATDWKEPKGYTQEELVKELADTENQLKTLDIQRRQQLLQLESLQKSVSDGMVYAEVDGVVKTVGDPEEPKKEGTAFLVVTGDEGLYVSGSISELLLGDVQVGTVVTANSWESGMTFEATITEISDYPSSSNSWGEGNPNVSYYGYTAYIEDSSALRNGEYVDLSISTNQSETGGLFIEKAYVRQEDGKAYCMIADENEKLKKQYVVTGRTVYGSAVEIKSGLTEEDRIAFPYGKNAVEGAAVTEASNMYY